MMMRREQYGYAKVREGTEGKARKRGEGRVETLKLCQ